MYYFHSLSRQDYKPLEHYGAVGNMETAALVGADGSIDWLCLPHLESPSVFGALLDAEKGGNFAVRPQGDFRSYQKYLERTNVLQTFFLADGAEAVLTDFMPPFKKRSVWHKRQILFRQVRGLKGDSRMVLEFNPRFSYGRKKAKLSLTDSGLLAEAGEEKLFLDVPGGAKIKNGRVAAEFVLKPGEEVFIVLQYNNRQIFEMADCRRQLSQTISFWRRWAHNCPGQSCVFWGPWHDLVIRSGLVLKLLIHGETGSIAAAATTSLPETVGGVRNWDYRFNWIRDSVFTVQALYNLGHKKEARELLNWYKRLYKDVDLKDVKVLYGLHGESKSFEKALKFLAGYKNSAPVRVGNKAARQRQLDVYGELLNMAYETSRYGEDISKNDWRLLKKIVNHVGKVWRKKDAGIWEIRSGYRHYVYSKIMCWVAVDRGIKIARKKNFPAPLEEWEKLRATLHKTILRRGYSAELNSFVQSFGSNFLDAASLLIPLVGFLPLTDPRVQGTIEASIKYLQKDGLVRRYNSGDGLPGREGGFIFCTYWLIDVLALSGRLEEAEKLYLNLLSYAGPAGLFAEEIDLSTKQQLGNFPQAFSHIGLINSALYIGLAGGYFKKGVKAVSPVENMELEKFGSILNLLDNPLGDNPA